MQQSLKPYYIEGEKPGVTESKYFYIDFFIKEKDDGLFHIGQSYEEDPASTVYCKKCGGNEFYVGTANHYTAIKCKKCRWEHCIHQG